MSMVVINPLILFEFQKLPASNQLVRETKRKTIVNAKIQVSDVIIRHGNYTSSQCCILLWVKRNIYQHFKKKINCEKYLKNKNFFHL